MVDCGVAELALPVELVEKLKLEPLGTIRTDTADGGEHDYRVCGIVELEVQGRKSGRSNCHGGPSLSWELSRRWMEQTSYLSRSSPLVRQVEVERDNEN